MSRTLKIVQTEDGYKKCSKYSSTGTPFCIRCNSRTCHGETEISRGTKSLSKSKFTKPKYKQVDMIEQDV